MCIINKAKRMSYIVDEDFYKNYDEGFLRRNVLSSFDKKLKNTSVDLRKKKVHETYHEQRRISNFNEEEV